MKKVTVSIRVTPADKKAFKEIFKTNGLSMSRAIELFLLRTIQEGKLPFVTTMNGRENQMLLQKTLNVEDTAEWGPQEEIDESLKEK